jgi:uncharacterized membrane-anchored protein YitT (DUF2179 family)
MRRPHRRVLERMRRKKPVRALRVPRSHAIRRVVYKQLLVAVGAIITALGYVLFMVPFQIAAGGVSGLGIIINHYTGLPVGMMILLLNIPLLALGFFHLGRWPFVIYTSISVIVFSTATDLFAYWLPLVMRQYPLSQDLLLNAIYAGTLFGIGTGIIYRAGSTIGGTSIPARILHNRTGFPLSQAYLFTDLAIILAAGAVFTWEKAMLALLTLILTGVVTDFVLEGISHVRTAMIVTDKPHEVSHGLMYELGRGASYWHVTGAYTEAARTLVYCTVRRSQVYDLRYVVSRIDPAAFVVVGTAQAAWGGRGFARLKKSKD